MFDLKYLPSITKTIAHASTALPTPMKTPRKAYAQSSLSHPTDPTETVFTLLKTVNVNKNMCMLNNLTECKERVSSTS